MKRWLAVVAGGFGLAAYLRRRRRHRTTEVEADPAEELRAKLAGARGGEARPEPEPAPESASESEPEPGEAPSEDDVTARRRDVHERGRKALDDLG